VLPVADIEIVPPSWTSQTGGGDHTHTHTRTHKYTHDKTAAESVAAMAPQPSVVGQGSRGSKEMEGL
jgi:hypothetical protein